MNLKKTTRAKRWFFIFILAGFVMGCVNSSFIEYPVSKYLTDDEQSKLLDKFIFDLTAPFDMKIASDTAYRNSVNGRVFKFRYFRKENSVNYFMITENHTLFQNVFRCFGGILKVESKDTIFDIKFNVETPAKLSEDSVKILFDDMVIKNR